MYPRHKEFTNVMMKPDDVIIAQVSSKYLLSTVPLAYKTSNPNYFDIIIVKKRQA